MLCSLKCSFKELFDREGRFLILGGGDVVLPMFLSVSLLSVNWVLSLATVGGMLVGLFVNHVVLVKRLAPLPALPCITAGALLGLFIGALV